MSTATNTVTSTVTVGSSPTTVAFSPDGKVAYVAVGNTDQLVSILMSDLLVGPSAPLGEFPISVVIAK